MDMTLLSLLLIAIVLAIVIGFFVGRRITERMKWGDKKRLIEQKYASDIQHLTQAHETEMMKLQKNTELELKDIQSRWEMKYTTELKEIKELIQGAEKYMRQDAVTRSRRTLLGKLWEQVSPYIPKFPFHPSDMKFIGAPIDFIVFDGMGEKEIKQVIFLEVKSGESKLNAQEKRLKEVIESGRVKWKQFNVDKPEKTKIDEIERAKEIETETSPHELYQHIEDKISEVQKEGKQRYKEDGETGAKSRKGLFCPDCGSERISPGSTLSESVCLDCGIAFGKQQEE